MNAASSPPRRSAPIPLAIALAFGAGLLAMAGFVGLSSEAAPPREEAPAVDESADVEAIAAEIAALRERNANARAELERTSAELEEAEEPEGAEPEPEPATSTPKKPRPKKPRPKQPRTEQPPTSTFRPIEIDDGRNPLDGLR